jgi:hypothetical protein
MKRAYRSFVMYDALQLISVDIVLMNAASSDATTRPSTPAGRKSSISIG